MKQQVLTGHVSQEPWHVADGDEGRQIKILGPGFQEQFCEIHGGHDPGFDSRCLGFLVCLIARRYDGIKYDAILPMRSVPAFVQLDIPPPARRFRLVKLTKRASLAPLIAWE
jgi:hypothetical protein